MDKDRLEERILVTVTVNMIDELDDFKKFKKDKKISSSYEAKIAYLVSKLHIHEKTAENLLSGNIVSRNNYLAVFPSCDPDSSSNTTSELEIWAEEISKKIADGDKDITEKVAEIITNRLDKLDLKRMAKAHFSDSMEQSVHSSLQNIKKPNKGTKILDYAVAIWIAFFYEHIFEKEYLYEIFFRLDLFENFLKFYPLAEKIFDSEYNIELFSKLADRLDLFQTVDEWDDWGPLEEFIRTVKTRNGFDD